MTPRTTPTFHRIARADVRVQYESLRDEIGEAIGRVLDSGRYVLGPEVEAFEAEFAEYCGARHCVTTASGTDALELAGRACGVGPGDEVVTVSLTMAATAFALRRTGATVRFADVDAATYTMDPRGAAEVSGAGIRALLPVHLYGQCAAMEDLERLAQEHGAWLIEDVAQAHGARFRGRRAGTLGHIGCFSFYPTKNLGGYGDGGAVVTDDASLAERVRMLRDHGRGADGRHVTVAGNSRLDELQAAVLRVKLRHLDGWNDARRRLASVYAERLAGLPLTLPHAHPRGEHAYHLYVVRTPRRDELRAHLKGAGVETGIHYAPPVHLHPAWEDAAPPGGLAATEECARTVLSLPMYPELSETDAGRVADCIHEFFA